jgi:hypothetical protein
VEADLQRVGAVLMRLADREIFPWLDNGFHLTGSQIRRAAMIVADRFCIADADTLLRTAQKQRQVSALTRWLEARGYRRNEPPRRLGLEPMSPGTYALDLTVPVLATEDVAKGLIPIDMALMPMSAAPHALPILVEVRSLTAAAGTPKRRAADATRAAALRNTYGPGLCLLLVLCGYLDSGYLGALAAEGIDWVWEHRIDDLSELGLGRPVHDERTPAPRSGLLAAATP